MAPTTAPEPVAPKEVSPGGVFLAVVRNPWFYLVRRWNWKSGVTSAIIRGAIFFTANLRAGLNAAVGALLAEFAYRTWLSGANGAVTQALRKSRPRWAADVAACVVLPLCNHAVEFTVHWLRGTPKLATGVIASLSFSVISILFNLYVQRRGVLVVDETDRKTLWQDMALMPRMIAGFLAVVPLALWRAVRMAQGRCFARGRTD